MLTTESLVRQFQVIRDEFSKEIDRRFPIDSIVRHGSNFAIVYGRPQECPPELVPLRFENGNIWWKPAEEIELATDKTKWHSWIIRYKRRRAGKKAAETRRFRERQELEMERR